MKTAAKVIARRTTYDGKQVELWSDGSLTSGLGRAIKGAPFNPKPARREESLAIGWLVLGDAGIYDMSEIGRLVASARYALAHGGQPGTMREHFGRGEDRKALTPKFVVTETDRDGNPVTRVWKLPRIGPWAGTAVWDHVSRGRGRQRYEVFHRVSGETYATSGMGFASQGELLKWMAKNTPRESSAQPRASSPTVSMGRVVK